MTDNTEIDKRLWRLLEVSDILDEMNHRLSLFMENFIKIETIKAAGYEEKDRAIVGLELERIKSIYFQEIEKRKREFMQKIFSEMKPELDELIPEEVGISIKYFESKSGRNFKDRIIPLSEKIDKAINEIGRDIIEKA